MGSHDPFGHLTHKLWPKEGSKVTLTIWLPPTKSQESPWFPHILVACNIPLERSKRGLQLFFKPYLNQRSAHKIMGPQNLRSSNFGNFGTPTWESKDKMQLGVGPMAKHKVYYKGEGGGFSQVRAVVNLVNPKLLAVHPNIKNVPIMH
jgi:hypothetical protein